MSPGIRATRQDSQDDSEEHVRKRPRVAAACDECLCSPCATRSGKSSQCTWGIRKGRGPGISKEDLQSLQRRIYELENGRSSQTSQHSAKAEEYVSLRPRSPPAGDDQEGHAGNAMLGLANAEVDCVPDNAGDSSARSFANYIKHVVDRQSVRASSSTQETPPSKQILMKSTKRRWSNKHPQLQDYVLPPRRRADHLLGCYWRLVNSLYPFLDPTEFEATYRQLWTGEEVEEDMPTFLCLLNIVFAIACSLDSTTPASKRAHEAEVFYNRGHKFLELDLLRDGSVLTIQCFLLLGQYLQSTNDSQQCWIFVGMAVRLAQSLGLDLPSTTQSLPPHEAETARRVWHGCVVMDRALSMTYGRSPMITQQAAINVSLPSTPSSHEEDEFSERTGCSTKDSTLCFLETWKLYNIMTETLTDWYSSPLRLLASTGPLFTTDSQGLGAKVIGKVLETDRDLWLWRCSLPARLRYGSSDQPGSAMYQRQRNILWIQHHHVRLLLFRPLLARFCARREAASPSDERVLPWKIMLQCCITCVEIAVETVSFLYETMSKTPIQELDDVLPAWWYTNFYLYSATTVLVAARLIPDVLNEISEDIIMGSWQKGLKMFSMLSEFSKHAARCAATLKALFDQVPEEPLRDPQTYQILHDDHYHHQRMGQKQKTPKTQRTKEASLPGQTPSEQYSSNTEPPTTAVDTWQFHAPDTRILDRSAVVAMEQPPFQSLINMEASFELLDLPEIQIDLNQLSWLTSFPTEL